MSDVHHNGDVSLPTPCRKRWQPLRGGLLNIYRYDYQEFWYEDGRLLLRGNNGTGKSRVLALQLPFLLDGEIVPQRVEPDQDAAKRMEWNLLLGGKYDDRLGYTWLEFARLLDSGEAEYKTIGCALRAVDGRGIAQQWFFVTKQRIGRDLFLENETRQPLSKAKLEAAVGDQGKVFGSGKVEEDRREYRNAVNKALFDLGDRYDGLINLLIQLRQPQLSRTLNETRLSEALSQALPPLPETVLGDVAEAFRGLENDRQELDDLKAARSSAELFLKEYQRYIQIVARRRAEVVRKGHSAYEATMRRLRSAEDELEQAKQELADLDAQLSGLSIEEQSAMAAESALRDSPEMKSVQDLENARVASVKASEDEENTRKDAEQSAATFQRQQQQWKTTGEKVSDASEKREKLATQALDAARSAALEDSHDKAVQRFDLNDSASARGESAAAALTELVKRRMAAIRHIEKMNDAVNKSCQQLASAQQVFDRAEGSLNGGIEAERESLKTVQNDTEALFAAYREWACAAREAHVPDSNDLEDEFASWCEAPEADSPIAKTIRHAEHEASHRLESERAKTKEQFRTAQERIEALERDRQRLQDGYHVPPPPPHTRVLNSRADRIGSTLWELCDFRQIVPESERANIEAALEASGLLDAWITPDGRLLDKNDHETVLAIGINTPPAGRSIDVVLVPSVQQQGARENAVSEATTLAILRQIGFGADGGEVWINSDGTWQVGPLRGSWSKPAPEHIGQASREVARLRQITELTVEIGAAKDAASLIGQHLQALTERFETLSREIAKAPSDGDVRQALAHANASREAVHQLRLQLTEAEAQFTEARRVNGCRHRSTQPNSRRSWNCGLG
jgi:uncharacterized protein (TIGR02680 family)